MAAHTAMLLSCIMAAILVGAHCQEVVTLPDNPDAECTPAVFGEATGAAKECGKSIFNRDEAPEACCKVLAEWYGPNSTKPSRNCFCVESYFTKLLEQFTPFYFRFMPYLDQCETLGYPIYYFQDGEGPCAPPAEAPAPAPEAEAPALAAEVEGEVVEELAENPPLVMPMRSFGGWLNGLDEDAWGLISFIAAIFAAIGSGIMFWTFVFDAFTDLRSIGGKRNTVA